MKKYVQEATDINIWTSIKNNTFGRNKDIKEFIDQETFQFHYCQLYAFIHYYPFPGKSQGKACEARMI